AMIHGYSESKAQAECWRLWLKRSNSRFELLAQRRIALAPEVSLTALLPSKWRRRRTPTTLGTSSPLSTTPSTHSRDGPSQNDASKAISQSPYYSTTRTSKLSTAKV